jgi:DNA polymerase sigma
MLKAVIFVIDVPSEKEKEKHLIVSFYLLQEDIFLFYGFCFGYMLMPLSEHYGI